MSFPNTHDVLPYRESKHGFATFRLQARRSTTLLPKIINNKITMQLMSVTNQHKSLKTSKTSLQYSPFRRDGFVR